MLELFCSMKLHNFASGCTDYYRRENWIILLNNYRNAVRIFMDKRMYVSLWI